MTTSADVLATISPEQFEQVLVTIAGIDPRNTTIIRELGAEYDKAVARAETVNDLTRIALTAIDSSNAIEDGEVINTQVVHVVVAALVDTLAVTGVSPSAKGISEGIVDVASSIPLAPPVVNNYWNYFQEDPQITEYAVASGAQADERYSAMTSDIPDDYAERKRRHDESVAEAERLEALDTPETTPSESEVTDHAILDKLDPDTETESTEIPGKHTPAKFLTNHPEKAETNGIRSPQFGSKRPSEPAGGTD